jgi:DNA polymerase
MQEEKALEKLKQEVNNCFKCDIANRCTQKVFGEGPLGIKVMSVSEAPGADEDREGRPYVGKAGKFWEGMLGTAGLSRDYMFVCNSLKCRPDNNKIEADYNQITNCAPFLVKQMGIIKPKLIIAFGKVAAFSLGLLPNKSASVSSVLGVFPKTYTYACPDGTAQTAQIVATYHPSYLMRGGKENDNYKSYLHLCDARRILDGLVN